MTGDVWRPLRRRVAVFTAAGGPLFAAYSIAQNSTLVGIVVGVPLATAAGFALGALAARVERRAVERVWIALGLVGFAVVASVVFAALDM